MKKYIFNNILFLNTSRKVQNCVKNKSKKEVNSKGAIFRLNLYIFKCLIQVFGNQMIETYFKANWNFN